MFPHLDAVFHFHVSEELSVYAEEAKLSLIIINHTVTLGGGLDESGLLAALWAVQGPQQVPIHGMDQTRTLCTQKDHVQQSVEVHTMNMFSLSFVTYVHAYSLTELYTLHSIVTYIHYI